MISILLPTRGRVRLLDHMLRTVYATVSSIDNVEIITRVDDDDLETLEYLKRRAGVKCVCKPRVGYALNAQMVNECAAEATGDLLLVANDDLEFQTPGWDLTLSRI